MRRRNLRVILLIAVVLSLAALSIGFKHVDLPGHRLDRGGTGPLGLTLGLDLRGGTHLIYQADSPTEINVAFQKAVDVSRVKAAVEGAGQTRATITNVAKEGFVVEIPSLAQTQEEKLKADLADKVAPIEEFAVTRKQSTELKMVFQSAPDEAKVRSVLQELSLSDAAIQNPGGSVFVISIPTLSSEDESKLKAALGDKLAPLKNFNVSRAGAATVILSFVDAADENAINAILTSLGYGQAVTSRLDANTITADVGLLDETASAALVSNLTAKLTRLENLAASPKNLARVEATFSGSVDEDALGTALKDLGFQQAKIVESRGTQFIVKLPTLSTEGEVQLSEALKQKLGEIDSLTTSRTPPTKDRMKGVIKTIERRVNAFGIAEPTVQGFGDDRVIVQLPGAGDSDVDLTFLGSVSEEHLRPTLKELGYNDATIINSKQRTIADTFVVDTPQLTPTQLETLSNDLTEKVSPLKSFSVDGTGKLRIGFTRPTAQEALRSFLDSAGYSNAAIVTATESDFRLRTSTLTTQSQNELRQGLQQKLAPISTFNVSGGVEQAKRLIGQTAQLAFKERTCEVPVRQGCGPYTDKDAVGDAGEPLTGDNLEAAFAGQHPTTGEPVINFNFDGTGTRVFRELTTRVAGNANRCIATFLDTTFLMCPTAERPIPGGSGFIEGGYTLETAKTMAIQLESGSLPVSLTLVRESTVDAVLGEESLRASLKAGLAGIGVVMLFMLVYYRMAGLVASLALISYAVVVLAILKMLPVTLTLSGLAGFILSIGMAVDANILIFERMKEEIRSGRSLLSAMDSGFRRAWSAIWDSNITTFIACAILFWFGNRMGAPVVSGFAVTLFVGVAVSMFTAITVSRHLLQLLAYTPAGKRLDLFTPEPLRRPVPVAGGEK